MAQKTTVILVDDLDGSEAIQTVYFAFGGQQYEIDLSPKHIRELADALDPFICAGRRVKPEPKRRRRNSPGRSRATVDRVATEPEVTVIPADPAAIRAWAASQPDVDVPSRGRIPKAAREAFDRAHTQP